VTFSVEYIVNTGAYEHVLWKIEEQNINALETSMNLMHAALLEKMGQLGALSKGAVSYGYANPDSVQSSTEDLIKSELGGKVLETTQKPAELEPGPVAQPAPVEPSEAPSRPWNKQPEVKQDKPWMNDHALSGDRREKPAVKQTVDSDDFFD
jgi:hypothetical protein